MNDRAENTYWEVDPEYFSKIEAVFHKRQVAVDLDILEVIKDMAAYSECMSLEQHVKEDLPYEFLVQNHNGFYLNFALMLKFLYPVMEEVETIVQNHIRLKTEVNGLDPEF